MTRLYIDYDNGETFEAIDDQDIQFDALTYGEFIPPLTYRNQKISKISLLKFGFKNDSISLLDNFLNLPNRDSVVFKVKSTPGNLYVFEVSNFFSI